MRLTERSAALYVYPDLFGRPVWTAAPFRARVTTTQRSAMELSLADVSGDWPLPDSVAYVGTESHPFVHVTRIRGIDRAGNRIFVAENEIDFSQHNRIYCPHLFVVLPKFQRVADVGGTPTVWKDYDLTPRPLPPKVNVVGPFHARANEAVALQLSWRNMEHGSGGGTVEHSVPDGDVVRDGNRLLVTCQLPGFRYVTVRVTDSAGTGVYHHPLFVATPRYRPFVRGGSLEVGRGWTLEVEVPFPPDESPYIEPYHVVAFVYGDRWWYGFVSGHDVELDYQHRVVRFTVRSSVAELGDVRSHAFSLEDGTRDSWYKLPGMTVARVAHLLLEFHSTFNIVTPVHYDPICDRRLKSNAFHDGSLLNQLTGDLLDDLLATVVQDTNGVAFVRRRPNLLWDRTSVPVSSVECAEVSVERATRVGLVKAGGFAYDTPLLARAPGSTPGYHPGTEERDGLIVEDQTDLNRCAGLILADENAGVVHARLFGDALMHDVLPGECYFNLGGVVTDVTSVRFRPVGSALLMEVEGKELTRVVPGETITVPSPPPPHVPEWPVPPPPEPPPHLGTGIAFVRAAHLVVRTRNVYSRYPYWEVVFNAAQYDGSGSSVADFRYLERGAYVAILVLTTQGNVWYATDAGAVPMHWELLLGRSRLQSLVGTQNIKVYQLMTFVQSADYVGLSLVAYYPDYNHRTYYVYTRDFGRSWNAVVVDAAFFWEREPTAIFNTAGTAQIYMLTSARIFGSATRVYRSENGGASWAYDGATHGPTFPTFKAYKPWQYGTSGRTVYAQLNVFEAEYRLGKSTDGCLTWSERIPSPQQYFPGRHSFEVWTFDPLHVVVALRERNEPHRVKFFVSRDGAATWSSVMDVPIDSVYSYATISVRGNPANRNEWTVLDTTGTSGGEKGKVRLVQTLDGGMTWRSLMGNWYDNPEIVLPDGSGPRYWFGDDYLILPPFTVVTDDDIE